jgi:hypothetical protein
MKSLIYPAIALAALNGLFFYLILGGGHTHLYDENHLIENIQAGALALAFLWLLGAAARRNEFTKWLTLFFATVCLTMFLREVDVEDLNVAGALKLAGSGLGRDLILGLGFISLLVCYVRFYRHLTGQVAYLIRSRVAVLSIVGSVLFVFGGVFEELDLQLLEEMTEMNGALLILIAALLFATKPESLTGNCTEPLTRR